MIASPGVIKSRSAAVETAAGHKAAGDVMGFGLSFRVLLVCGLAGVLAQTGPALSGGLYDGASQNNTSDQWQFSFTPYSWATSINGDVTARGHKAHVNEGFIEIIEKSNSMLAWMSYFEARKGRFALFTDLVWADLGFPGRFDVIRSPLGRFDRATLNVQGRAQLDYQQTIIQSGIAYEIARWQSAAGSTTALDLMGSARYWNQDVDLSLRLTGTLTVDLRELGLRLQRTRNVAVARSGNLEWVDPVVGARIRHQMASGSDVALLADFGGFGAGSEFSWQLVGTYGFDVTCFGTPFRTLVGYRALDVDYSENGRHGTNALDVVQHGPIMGVNFRW